MTCVSEPLSQSDMLISFAARYTLTGQLTGSLRLANPDCTFVVTCEVCQPVALSLEGVTSGVCGPCGDLSGDTCFTENPNWLAGLVVGYQEADLFDDVPTIVGNVVSYHDYLKNKPINTEQFKDVDLSIVLSDIASTYAGLRLGLLDFNIPVGFTNILGPVSGNSTLDELKKLAQAGYANLFTQVGGKLTIEQWKDHTSPVDYVIPSELLTSAEKSPVSPGRVTMVKCRGAGVSKYDCGKQVFTDSRTSTTANGGYSNIAGPKNSCAVSGIPTPTLNLSFDNLAAAKEDVKNAEIESDNVDTSEVFNVEDGSFTTAITNTDGSYFGPGKTDFQVMVSGFKRPHYEYTTGDGMHPIIGPIAQKRADGFQEMWSNQGIWPWPNNSFYSGGFGNDQGNASGTYYADQTSIERIETSVINPAISDCGVRVEQIDNPYVMSKEVLFLIGIRRFQEMHMQENTWLIEVPYIPCLKINQVVQFNPSCQEGCSDTEITGLIAGIEIRYDAKPDVTMKIVVWGFECLGGTAYISENLIISPCAGAESAAINPWIASAIDLNSQAQVDEYSGTLYTFGFPSEASLDLVQDEMVNGHDYTVSFDYELIEGFGILEFTHPGGLSTFSGNGSHSSTFTAGFLNFTFEWLLRNTFVPTMYQITNIKLTKSIIT